MELGTGAFQTVERGENIMLKKILTAVLFIALAAGTVYSWQRVDFSRKTAMFFQVVFGDQTSMGGPGGRPPMGENRGGDMSRQQPPNGWQQGRGSQGAPSAALSPRVGDENGNAPDFGQRQPGGRPPGGGGPGRGPGGNVSLGNVAKYTVIMAFFVMFTCLLDRSLRKLSRSRRTC